MDAPVVAGQTETETERQRQSGLVAPTARGDAVARVFSTPELPDNRETEAEREAEREAEYDAETVASLLWPDDAAPQREWIDGPVDQVLSCESSTSLPSARRRRSSGSIVDALINESIADEAQAVECDAVRSQAKQEEQRRQLDALELQLAKLEAEKRALCSELDPARTKGGGALPPSRLRASAASVNGEPARDGPKHRDSSAVNKHDIEIPREVDPDRAAQKCPAAFICPITQDIFRFPVIAGDGHSYERQAIETWLASTNAAPTSPVTNLPLPTTTLFPNHGLRSQVLEWMEKEGLPLDDSATASAQSETGYGGLVPVFADTDTDTDDSDDDDADPFDLALSEALRRSLIDQQMSGHLVWHHPPQWNAIETSHVAELMRARRARGLRPAVADTTGSPTLRRDVWSEHRSTGGLRDDAGGTYGGNTQQRRSSACTVM